MDTPLLALAKRRAGGVQPHPSDSTAAEIMRPLVQLRWIAVAGQTVTILLVHFGLGVPLPIAEMLGLALALALANVAIMVALPRHRVRHGDVVAALLVDMVALTLQLYLSGGAANPFISLYLLQVALGAILLSPAAAAMLAVAAALGYALLSIHALPLKLPESLAVEGADLFAIGGWISFAMVATLLLLFIVRISRNLQARDAYLADLRQHAAEEEGIVRMGLFASGAAHELGTPLATVFVILSDWRREPKIAGDPGLSAELEEMLGEVRRCKSIVSDILHSAGQPRGEAMGSTPALAFLGAVVEDWTESRPNVPLVFDRGDAGGAAIAADPSLRQAIWNLLENAAEASHGRISLSVTRDAQMLVVTVRDQGPGFDQEALDHVGELYRSTKGAGHGLGLFLASSVARRLGGRLEARNLEDIGAEVRLWLPLAVREESQ